ncbi:hypothetical protein BGX20_003644 [Mortierella sp. AD010]|nr:hypothetical protein BGX20_003644 [Mortierella sp. AD010]
MHFVRKHATCKNDESQPNVEFECSHCKSVFLSVESLDEHLDVHSEIYEEEPADDNNIQESQASSLLSQTKIKLNEATHDRRTTDYILEYVVPYRVRTNGRELMAFLIPGEAEQVSKDPIEGWLRIDQGKAPMEVDPGNLEIMLTSHQFGSIIDVKHYSPMDPELFMKPFRPNKDDIAKRLAGSIIQTGTQAILVLKAEIYGRRPSDDPHEFALIMPYHDVKKISIVFHDNSRKLVVGTNTWSSLLTASIELTSGTIEVGASNSTVNIARTSLIWCRDDCNQNLLVERQLRSKFDKSQTYWDCAAVFFLFSDWRCQPATIFQIVNHYYSKKMSGIKAAAVIFNGLLSSSIIKKSSLEELRTQLQNNKLSAGSVALQIIEKLIAMLLGSRMMRK